MSLLAWIRNKEEIVFNSYALYFLIAGLIIGAGLAWMVFRMKTSQKISEGLQPLQSELAVIGERLKARDTELQGFSADNQEMELEIRQLRQTLLQEGQEKAAAMKEAEQLTELRGRLLDRENELKTLREEVTALKQVQAEFRKPPCVRNGKGWKKKSLS